MGNGHWSVGAPYLPTPFISVSCWKPTGRWGPCFFRFLGLCWPFSKMATSGGITFRSRSCTERPFDAEEKIVVVFVHLLSCVQLFATSQAAGSQGSLSSTISHSLLKLMSIVSMMSSNHLILCRPLLLLPLIFPIIRGFSNELALGIRWTKYWSFSFSISLSSEYSVLISFGIDWFNFLAVQGTFKSSSAPQLKSISSSLLRIMVQLTFVND